MDANLVKFDPIRAEMAKLKQIEADRVADEKHRADVEVDVIAYFNLLLNDGDMAEKLFVHIASNECKFVTINY